jgi:hypothetical protein
VPTLAPYLARRARDGRDPFALLTDVIGVLVAVFAVMLLATAALRAF